MDWQKRYETGDTPWEEGAAHPALFDFIAEAGPFEGRIQNSFQAWPCYCIHGVTAPWNVGRFQLNANGDFRP